VFTAIFLVILAAILFGLASPLSKLILNSISPFQLAGLLYLGAALGVAPRLIVKKKLTPLWRITRRSRWLLIGAISCGGVLAPLALLFGLKIGQASSVSLWLNLELVFTALLGHLFFHDHLNRTGWIALGGVIAASLMLAGGGGQVAIISGLLVALACLFWGFDNHFTALIDGITPSESTFWKGIVAGSVNLGIWLVLEPNVTSWQLICAALLVGVFCYGISIVLYITAAQTLGATRGQMFFSTAPLFGMGLSVLMFGNKVSPIQLMAAVLFVVSLIVLFVGRHSHLHFHRSTTHEHWHRHNDGHHTHMRLENTSGKPHVHEHEHEESEHSHPHLPDFHHRHVHKE
jgi:drug/metabolite transporter (DMT)-like permease